MLLFFTFEPQKLPQNTEYSTMYNVYTAYLCCVFALLCYYVIGVVWCVVNILIAHLEYGET